MSNDRMVYNGNLGKTAKNDVYYRQERTRIAQEEANKRDADYWQERFRMLPGQQGNVNSSFSRSKRR